MDFLVCKCVLSDLHMHRALEDLKDEDEAVSKAQEIAIRTKEGATVGLFTREGDVVCGWKVGKDGGLRTLPVEQVEDSCGVGPGHFELAKREPAKRRKARERQQAQQQRREEAKDAPLTEQAGDNSGEGMDRQR